MRLDVDIQPYLGQGEFGPPPLSWVFYLPSSLSQLCFERDEKLFEVGMKGEEIGRG